MKNSKKKIAIITALLTGAGSISMLNPVLTSASGATMIIDVNKEDSFTYPAEFDDFLNNTNELLVNKKLLAIEQKGKEIKEEREQVERELARLAEIERISSENNRKDSVAFNPYNLLSPSNITGDEFHKVLLNSPRTTLADYAWDFIYAEELYGVNAFFLAALVAQESSWGTSDRAKYQNNMTGYAVFNRGAAGADFNSKHRNIVETTELLKKMYLTPSGKYYSGGLATTDVNVRYCLDEFGNTDYGWSSNINSIANGFASTYHSKVKKLEDLPN